MSNVQYVIYHRSQGNENSHHAVGQNSYKNIYSNKVLARFKLCLVGTSEIVIGMYYAFENRWIDGLAIHRMSKILVLSSCMHSELHNLHHLYTYYYKNSLNASTCWKVFHSLHNLNISYFPFKLSFFIKHMYIICSKI